jgi:hypothetical protein
MSTKANPPQSSTPLAETLKVRCIVWFNVTETAPSGRRYRFEPQQVRGVGLEDGNVHPDDVEYLLGLQKPGGGCCGTVGGPYPYFVKE